MYKLIKALSLSILLSIAVFAQTTTDTAANNSDSGDSKKAANSADQTTTPGEYNKNEYYIGYSNQQTNRFGRTGFNGIEGSYTRNVSRWFGIRGSLSYAKSERTFRGTLSNPAGGTYDFQQDNIRSVTNILGGIQIKDNASTKRFKPFAFALGGVAINTSKFKRLACVSSGTTTNCPASIPLINNFTFTDTGISGAFGGGLDIKITDRIDFRAIQFDYNPVYSNSRVDNNFRFGIGIVFR